MFSQFDHFSVIIVVVGNTYNLNDDRAQFCDIALHAQKSKIHFVIQTMVIFKCS